MVAASQNPRARPGAGAFWILVVDDEAGILDLVQRALTRNGYPVTPCSTGAEARRALTASTQPPALIIVDVLLPDTEGTHIIDAARALEPATPAIVISGLDEAELQPFAATADVVLTKPFSITTLLDLVRELAGEAPLGE